MRRMGMDVQQLDDVTEVIIRFPDHELVLSEPQVVTMKAQEDNVYQIIGQPEERSLTVSSEAEAPSVTMQTFSDEDVQLVATQANVSEDDAREALRNAGGNLAKAIIALTEG